MVSCLGGIEMWICLVVGVRWGGLGVRWGGVGGRLGGLDWRG